MGLMTAPKTRSPRTHSQWVVGPGRTPERTSGRGGEAPDPGRPTPRQEAPPRAPSCCPHHAQSQLARARAVGLVTGPHARTPGTQSQLVVGPGRTPERTSGWGWESARPRTPHTQARGAPLRVPSCHPHSAQSQLARVRPVGLVTGPHACTPGTHSQWVVGPGRTPERTSGRGWESARPRTPHTQARGAPPGALLPPPGRANPACKSARGGVGDGSPRPQPPHGERAAPIQVGENKTGPPPPPSMPNGARDRGRTRRGAQTAWNGPTIVQHRDRAGCACHTNRGREGGGRGRREGASAHTHKGHAGKTRRATGPSPRNAQTAWNGVPASEDKGHPDGTARHTQRRKRGAARGKRERHNDRHRPQTPPNRPRARRTNDQDTAPAKAVVAPCATHGPNG